MSSTIQVDTIKDIGGNTMISSNSSGTFTNSLPAPTSGIAASAIDSGTIATARLGSGTASSSSFLRGDQTYAAPASGGITSADTWRVTVAFQGDATPIASNWERADTYSPGYIGTGMSQSSGIFTFPSTGIWDITFNHTFSAAGDNQYIESTIDATTDNSSYNMASKSWQGATANAVYGMASCKFLFDVTNTTTHKLRFSTTSQDADAYTQTSTNTNLTYVTFIRLGNT